MLRVKNEARWIQRSIESLLPFCEQVLVLDDSSTDDTRKICAALPKVTVLESPFSGLDEVRDKNYLLKQAEQYEPGWIIAIDGDEALSEAATKALPELLRTSRAPCLSLRIRYLWNDEQTVRADGVYGDFHRESVFRPDGSRFVGNGGPNFHCGNVPAQIRQHRQVVNLDVLHYGYLHRADRLRKYDFYNSRDPQNRVEDLYRHTVIGDLFPADSHFVHGGPLRLEPLHTMMAQVTR